MSGRKSRETRRVAAPPSTSAQALRERRPLLLVAALAAAALVVAAIVGVSLTFKGGGSNGGQTAGGKLPGAASVLAEFRGVPQRGLALGSPTAPTTLVEYLDLQCPWCGVFARETFPTVMTRFVRTGQVRVEMRPLDFVGSDSVRGRNALFAAALQNRAFQFAALLYAHQGTENTGWLSSDMVRAAAASVPGLDEAKVVAAGPSDALAERIEQQRAGDGVTGVPTVFVRRTGESGPGTMLVNPSEAELTAALRSS
jgi:protein-disulfide isomerase